MAIHVLSFAGTQGRFDLVDNLPENQFGVAQDRTGPDGRFTVLPIVTGRAVGKTNWAMRQSST